MRDVNGNRAVSDKPLTAARDSGILRGASHLSHKEGWMRQVLMIVIATVTMAIGGVSGIASADTPDHTTASATNQCPTRWVDPIYDCVQFENEVHNLACARLADKINTTCGLQKPDLQTATAPAFDPLDVD